jgi:hypothetical protein
VIDESDSQSEKHFDPRISIFPQISIRDDSEKHFVEFFGKTGEHYIIYLKPANIIRTSMESPICQMSAIRSYQTTVCSGTLILWF